MPISQQPQDGIDIALTQFRPSNVVLDVGAGDGKWGLLLRGRVNRIIGVEVWEDYINKYDLRSKYDEVVHCDIRYFNFQEFYDVIILGDVFEHLLYNEAVALLPRLKNNCYKMLLTIPISYCPQDGTVYGNPYETHWYQWSDNELRDLGFKSLHQGLNPNGKVMIGTYVWISESL